MFRALKGRVGLWAGLGCAVFAVLGGASAGASASSNVPCSGAGGGAAGLVAAINAANAGGGGTINLAPGCTYLAHVSQQHDRRRQRVAGHHLRRSRSTAAARTIAGNNSNFRIILIAGAAGGRLTLNGITITGGNASGQQPPASFGGGIFNFAGTLTPSTRASSPAIWLQAPAAESRAARWDPGPARPDAQQQRGELEHRSAERHGRRRHPQHLGDAQHKQQHDRSQQRLRRRRHRQW